MKPSRLLLGVCLFTLMQAHAISDTEAATAAASPAAPAVISPTAPGFHFFIVGGITYGGDTLTTTFYTNGSTNKVKAGSLYQGGLGGLYQLADLPLALALSTNWHFDSAPSSNRGVMFSRFPIEALVYYTGQQRLRIGGGVRRVHGAEITADVNGITQTITFNNTRGLVAEIGYQLSNEGWLNFRFVSEKYQGKTSQYNIGLYSIMSTSMAGTPPYNGSHLGVNFLYQF